MAAQRNETYITERTSAAEECANGRRLTIRLRWTIPPYVRSFYGSWARTTLIDSISIPARKTPLQPARLGTRSLPRATCLRSSEHDWRAKRSRAERRLARADGGRLRQSNRASVVTLLWKVGPVPKRGFRRTARKHGRCFLGAWGERPSRHANNNTGAVSVPSA
jgi:hypothetical protein